MTFQPDTGATVTISGADVVTGWSAYSGNIYQSSGMTWNLCSPTDGTSCVGWNQLFVDGNMVHLARWPNMSPSTVWPTWATSQPGHPTQPEFDASAVGGGFNYNPWVLVDSNLPNVNWVGAEVTFETVFVLQSGTVTNSQPGQITFTNLQSPEERAYQSGTTGSYRYYLSNTLSALDTAGEWYFNPSTHTLYLWPPASDNPASHTVEAKHRQYAIQLIGRSGITFKNINVFASSITTDVNSTGNTFDGVNVTYVWHQLRNVPNHNIISEQFPPNPSTDAVWAGFQTGIYLDGNNTGSASNVFKNCTVAYSSHDGFYLHHNHQTVTNCTIHDVNYMGADSGFVSFEGDQAHYAPPIHTSNHQVTYNTMYNAGRNGVNDLGSGFLVSHNIIHDTGLITRDNGFTYAYNHDPTLLQVQGEWSYNIVYNNRENTYAPKGLYGDGSTSNMLIHHNVIYQTSGYLDEGIILQDTSANLQIYNNTIYNVSASNADIGAEGTSSNNDIRNNFTTTGLIGQGTCASCTLTNNVTGNQASHFVNAAAGDFRLSPSAPARNAGVVISGITIPPFTDANPSAGAYEYGQPPWPVGVQLVAGPPTIMITAPVNVPNGGTGTYSTNVSPLTTLTGTATSTGTGLSVTLSCTTCSGGTVSGTTSWSVASLGLSSGSNTVTMKATDSNGSSTATLTVTYTPSTAPTIQMTAPVTVPSGLSGSYAVNTATLAGIGGTATWPCDPRN
jgi:hypothetical protein